METKGKTTKRVYKATKEGTINKTGRIRNFEKENLTPEDIEDKAEEYFNSGSKRSITYYVAGKPVTKEVNTYTLPGLCYYLGIESRQHFRKIMIDSKNIYSFPLKKAYLKIQESLELLSIHNGNPGGPVFILKNMDYSDQTTVNQNVTEVKKPEIITPDKETGKEVRSLFKHTG